MGVWHSKPIAFLKYLKNFLKVQIWYVVCYVDILSEVDFNKIFPTWIPPWNLPTFHLALSETDSKLKQWLVVRSNFAIFVKREKFSSFSIFLGAFFLHITSKRIGICLPSLLPSAYLHIKSYLKNIYHCVNCYFYYKTYFSFPLLCPLDSLLLNRKDRVLWYYVENRNIWRVD